MQMETGKSALPLIGAAGAGAALMYLFDPQRGRRRRHLVSDQLIHAGHVATDALGTTRRDITNRARGAGATVRRRVMGDQADDRIIEERVRAELGRVVSHPGAIEVSAGDGRITLRGPVLAHEADELITHVRRVRGVTSVVDDLELHEQPGDLPGLQGAATVPAASRFELLQDNWTPAARLLTGAAGGALAVYALTGGRRHGPVDALLGLAGTALLARGAANKPFRQLVGVGAGRRAVSVQKTINIAAPIDEVFDWLTEWERLPQWMSHVREVTRSGEPHTVGERTHWVVDGPAGTALSWDAVTTRIERPTLVSWKTVGDSPIAHSGTVRLARNYDGSTRVDVHMTYNPIAGAAGHAVATLLGRDPKRQMDDDLARLKSTIESGKPPRDAAAAARS
jgi:uncharacterized membrane protein